MARTKPTKRADAPKTIPPHFLRDAHQAAINNSKPYRPQYDALDRLLHVYMAAATWKTEYWGHDWLIDDDKDAFAEMMTTGELGGYVEQCKEAVAESGFQSPASWLLPTFFGLKDKPLTQTDRDAILSITTLIVPWITKLRPMREDAQSIGLAFGADHITYNGQRTRLTGKAWSVLRAIANSRHGVKTRAALRQEVWDNDALVYDEAIKVAVSDARKALKTLIGKNNYDPIPVVNKGDKEAMGWKLSLPTD